MEHSQKRTEALAPMRERVTRAVGLRLDDKACIQMALACAIRAPDDVVGFLFAKHVAPKALAARADLAITPAEWDVMFGRDTPPLRDGGVTELVQSGDFAGEAVRLEGALRCTIAEREQGTLYARAWTRACIYIAVHTNEPDKTLAASLGTVSCADARRLDDLREEIDDDAEGEDTDTLLLSKLLMAMSESVV